MANLYPSSVYPTDTDREEIPGLVLVGGYETTETRTLDITDTLTVEAA